MINKKLITASIIKTEQQFLLGLNNSSIINNAKTLNQLLLMGVFSDNNQALSSINNFTFYDNLSMRNFYLRWRTEES